MWEICEKHEEIREKMKESLPSCMVSGTWKNFRSLPLYIGSET